MVNEAKDIIFTLLKSAITGSKPILIDQDVDWREVIDLSFEQGVSAISVDGYHKWLYEGGGDSHLETDENLVDQKFRWLGSVLFAEENYRRYATVLSSLTRLFAGNGLKMMVFKGYSLSLDYPIPEHRASGDIDVYLYGKGSDADKLVQDEFGIEVKQNEDKHSTFFYQNILVENHASFTNTVEYPSHLELERFLLSEAEKANPIDLNGSSVYIPTPMLNAAFLPCHIAGHFVYGGMSMTQLVDWAVFVNKYHDEVDWHKVFELADEVGYLPFLKCLNGIVVRYLGVNPCIVPADVGSVDLQDRILDEMFNHRVDKNDERYLDKVKRYFKLKWKYDLVFKDNYYHTFFRRSWASFRGRHLKYSRSVWS